MNRRLRFASFALAVLVVGTSSPAIGGSILNGSFETGDFTGWTTLGATSVVTASFGTGPTDGVYQAFLSNGTGARSSVTIANFLGLDVNDLHALAAPQRATEGSIITQEITAVAGSILSFDWNFLTNEATPNPINNDLAFWMLLNDNTGIVLANTLSTFVPSGTSFWEETGYHTFTYTIATSGTFTLVFGVMDVDAVNSTTVDSGLLIDNVRLALVPEPSAAILFALGTLGAALVRGLRKGRLHQNVTRKAGS